MKAKKQETKNVNLNNVKKLSSLELSQIKGGAGALKNYLISSGIPDKES